MPHMDRAFVIFENKGEELRFSVTEPQYREFQKSNPPFNYKLICPDPFCGGEVHAHIAAQNRRAGATHAYTEAGFAHNKDEATDACRFSYKNDPRFANLEENKFLPETVAKVRDRFATERLALLEDLQTLLGPKADCIPHFTKMQRLLEEHEYFSLRPRMAPLVYVTRLPPFEMTLHNGKVRRVAYMQNGQQQSETFHSLRGHPRTEWVPKSVLLVYSPKLTPVPNYQFDVTVGAHLPTEIERPLGFRKRGPQSERPHGRVVKVRPDAYLQPSLKFG